MERLPLDLVVKIAGLLAHEDLAAAPRVCRGWHKAFTDPSLFRRLFLVIGVAEDALPSAPQKWRKSWWRFMRRDFHCPGAKPINEHEVLTYLQRWKKPNSPANLEIAFVGHLGGVQEMIELLQGIWPDPSANHMLVPPTPARASGFPDTDNYGHPFLLKRYKRTVDLWRSRGAAEHEAYDRPVLVHHGHILCFVIKSRCDLKTCLIQAEAYRGWHPDGTPVCYLELSPCDLNPDKMLRRQIRLRNVLHILLPPPVTHADFRWALDLIVAYGAQRSSDQPLPTASPPIVFEEPPKGLHSILPVHIGPIYQEGEEGKHSEKCVVS